MPQKYTQKSPTQESQIFGHYARVVHTEIPDPGIPDISHYATVGLLHTVIPDTGIPDISHYATEVHTEIPDTGIPGISHYAATTHRNPRHRNPG